MTCIKSIYSKSLSYTCMSFSWARGWGFGLVVMVVMFLALSFLKKKEWFVCIDETNFSQILSLLLKNNDIQFHNTLSQDIYAAHFLYISDTQKCILGSTDVNQWYVEISKFIVFFFNFSSGSSGFNKWLKCKVYRYFA